MFKRMYTSRSTSAPKLLNICKGLRLQYSSSRFIFIMASAHRMRGSGYPVLIYFSLLFVFSHFLFFPLAQTNKSTHACSLSLSQHFLSDPTPPPQISCSLWGGGGGVKTDIIVVMVTDGSAPFTKTSFACSFKKRLRHTSAAERAGKTSTQQDVFTGERRASLFLFKSLKIWRGHSPSISQMQKNFLNKNYIQKLKGVLPECRKFGCRWWSQRGCLSAGDPWWTQKVKTSQTLECVFHCHLESMYTHTQVQEVRTNECNKT